jgi:hypothetical protein
MTEAVVNGQASVAQTIAGPSKRRRLRRRHLWLIPGLAIAVYANMLGQQHGVGILELIAFGLAPDVPRLLRRLGAVPGSRLARLGTPLFNVLHHPLVALAAFALAAGGAVNDLIPMVVLVATMVWSGHIAAGWAVGDAIRREQVQR